MLKKIENSNCFFMLQLSSSVSTPKLCDFGGMRPQDLDGADAMTCQKLMDDSDPTVRTSPDEDIDLILSIPIPEVKFQ